MDREREDAARSSYGLLVGRDVDRRTRRRVWRVVLLVEAVGLLCTIVVGYVVLPFVGDTWLVTAMIGAAVTLFVGTLFLLYR
jgi:hypothetical protein